MSFAAAVERLSALGLELAPGAPRRKFELAHMRTLAAALGDPQTKFPSVLIAGTNGKGSTAATLASILAAAGYRTGLYTSPHLERVTERIRISGSAQIRAPFIAQPRRVMSGIEPHRNDAAIPPREGAPASESKDPRICFLEILEDDFARLF